MKRVAYNTHLKRAVAAGITVMSYMRKTLRSLRKNALKMLLEPHVYTYVKVIRGLVTINLGGTAEAVFRPMGDKDGFYCFQGISRYPVFFNESERGFRWI